jgi:hypothetical protein
MRIILMQNTRHAVPCAPRSNAGHGALVHGQGQVICYILLISKFTTDYVVYAVICLAYLYYNFHNNFSI